MSRKYPIRSSQLVMPSGIGAMITEKGKSLIVAGCESWFPGAEETRAGSRRGGKKDSAESSLLFDESEFIIREPRLENRLRVSGFRRPPDYREQRFGEPPAPNIKLTIPVLRFPQWHFCSRCGLMEFLPLTEGGKVFCRSCRDENLFMDLAQMSFVALCERGHLQDFPYREWAHREHHPACSQNLYYIRTGSGTLAGQKIKCECGVSRSLLNIDKANFSDTYLSFYLSPKDGIYFCRGHRPWLGQTIDAQQCTAYLRGNPRNAGNVWFPQTVSAINLPQTKEEQVSHLAAFLRRDEVRNIIRGFSSFNEKNIVGLLKVVYPAALNDYDDGQIEQVWRSAQNPASSASTINSGMSAQIPNQNNLITGADPGVSAPPLASAAVKPNTDGEISEEAFRYPEFLMLRESRDEETLLTRRIDLKENQFKFPAYFSRLVQVHRLRETKAFTGFSRIFSDNALALDERKALLRLSGDARDWLPATTVYGEGIYLELNEETLAKWLKGNSGEFKKHLAPINDAALSKLKRQSGKGENISGGKASALVGLSGSISPVFILIHTLAHLLIKELTFECGYGASALRERIYFSEKKETKMAGVLIYTADGDSEGTLGGLVRLATLEIIEKILGRALLSATRCSLDPFCTETGIALGQGPDNCNLAACHACALLPETSCEEFNKYLDRALLVTIGNALTGYFDI